METVIIVIHLMVVTALVGVVLLQRSEGGALGMGGGGGGLMSSRGTANVLTRTTAILAAVFFATSLVLAILAGTHTDRPASILDRAAPPSGQGAPAPGATPGAPAPGGGQGGILDQLQQLQRPAAPAPAPQQ
jgi:preprotein translocase subunit SecG